MRRPGTGPRVGGRSAEGGYNLVILIFLIVLANLSIAAALPSWTGAMQREKEEELIFRGMQYAEAIRRFQAQFGRAPVRLEELVEARPRTLRQLFPNPMTDDGSWGLLLQTPTAGQRTLPPQGPIGPDGQPVPPPGGPGIVGSGVRNQTTVLATRGRTGGAVAVPPTSERDSSGRRAVQRTTGPIIGVYAGISGDAKRTFMGQTNYESWHFTFDLVPLPVAVAGEVPLPRANSGLVGRPFPDDLQPQSGGMPQQVPLDPGRPPGGPPRAKPTPRR